MRRLRLARNHKGISLMEMTIMIAIGSVLFVSVGRAVQTQVKVAIDNRNYLIALNLAKWQMGIANNMAYPGAAAAEAAQTADTAFPNFIPTREIVDVTSSGSNTVRQIIVRVRLGSAAGPVLIRLDTYRSNIITFGNGS